MELPKLFDKEIPIDEDDPIVQWMMFIDAKSKGVMEMLAEKNKDIGKAFNFLQIISQDEKARMAYEARQAEIMDQLTRLKSAREEGLRKGREEGLREGKVEGLREGKVEGMRTQKIEIAKKLIKKGMDIADISDLTELTEDEIKKLMH